MITTTRKAITVKTTINAPVEKVWIYWTNPKHIIHWNHASHDWYTPRAENDLRTGGKFLYRMEARDGSGGFDFAGEYTRIVLLKQIKYTLGDGRNVQISFSASGNESRVKETFEVEQDNTIELQQEGWQAILDNFRNYVERSDKLERLHYEVIINAHPEYVYTTMIDPIHYSEWTGEFNPTSHFKGSWDKGSKILFIGDSQEGGTGGMVSNIKENIPGRFLSIEHVGIIRNDEEIYTGPEIESWKGALEDYSFVEMDGKTHLSVDVDTDYKFKTYFNETWPKALTRLKLMCER